jgi:hypothetical protein
MAEIHELPIHEIYRDCELYGLSPPSRIAEAKRQIDAVIAMTDGRRLADFACDPANSPEARLLSKHKAMASLENRQRKVFDVNLLSAATVGIARRETTLGRLIAWRQAEWWPQAWLPRP